MIVLDPETEALIEAVRRGAISDSARARVIIRDAMRELVNRQREALAIIRRDFAAGTTLIEEMAVSLARHETKLKQWEAECEE